MTNRDVNVNFHSCHWVDGIVILVNTDFFKDYLVASETDSLFENIGRGLDAEIKEEYGVNNEESDSSED